MGIDDILNRGKDPRRNKFDPVGMSKIEEEKQVKKFLTSDDLNKFKQNQEFFR